MPIRSFLERGHSFDDEAIRIMGLAYEFARSELRITGKNELKEKIATKIIELAASGERDPDKLCEFAIKGLRKRKNSPRAVRPELMGQLQLSQPPKVGSESKWDHRATRLGKRQLGWRLWPKKQTTTQSENITLGCATRG
jgi:hypothetical protein